MKWKKTITKSNVHPDHIDWYKHLTFSRYFDYYGKGIDELLKENELDGILKQLDNTTLVLNSQFEFKKPLLEFQEIEIHSNISEYHKGNGEIRKLSIEQEVMSESEKASTAKIVFTHSCIIPMEHPKKGDLYCKKVIKIDDSNREPYPSVYFDIVKEEVYRRRLGLDNDELMKNKKGFLVIKAEYIHILPFVPNHEIEMICRVLPFEKGKKTARMYMHYEMYEKENLIANGLTEHFYMDLEKGRPTRLPQELIQKVQ